MIDLEALAAAWWQSDGSSNEFEIVADMVSERRSVPQLISALVSTAPSGALPYIGICVVEDLAFQVEWGEMSGSEALGLVLGSGLPSSDLFQVLSGAYVENLRKLNELRGAPLSDAQRSWLLDEHAQNRWVDSGQTLLDDEGVRFVPGRTSWQAELELRRNARG